MVFEPVALAPEQDGDVFAGRAMLRHFGRGAAAPTTGLGLVMGARGGGQHEGAVGDGRFKAVVEHRLVENAVGAGRHHQRLVVRPALRAA